MYSKRKMQYIVDVLAPILIKELKLEDHEITIEIQPDTKAVEYEELCHESLFGVTIWPNDRHDKVCTIILFYRTCRGWKCAVDTLFHELLHVRMAALYRYAINPKLRRSHEKIDELEEEIVSAISNATVKLALSLDKLRDHVL